MTTAIALNCTLKGGDAPSSTARLLGDVAAALRGHGVTCETVHVASLDIRPGVTSDEGDGDAWPALRRRILAADLLVIGTPIWLGQPSSVAKRVLERMDAFLGEGDDAGRLPTYGKVAMVAVVGNEDGAHHVAAELFQALNDVGYSLASNASTYWVGVARGSTDYKDLAQTPEDLATSTRQMARNAVHLQRLLAADGYPAD